MDCREYLCSIEDCLAFIFLLAAIVTDDLACSCGLSTANADYPHDYDLSIHSSTIEGLIVARDLLVGLQDSFLRRIKLD
jgi:hypothetical protein